MHLRKSVCFRCLVFKVFPHARLVECISFSEHVLRFGLWKCVCICYPKTKVVACKILGWMTRHIPCFWSIFWTCAMSARPLLTTLHGMCLMCAAPPVFPGILPALPIVGKLGNFSDSSAYSQYHFTFNPNKNMFCKWCHTLSYEMEPQLAHFWQTSIH